MITICYNLQLNEYFSTKFTQDEPLWTKRNISLSGFLISRPFVIQGRQNIGSKSGYKIYFKEELLQITNNFKILLGHQIKEYRPTLR